MNVFVFVPQTKSRLICPACNQCTRSARTSRVLARTANGTSRPLASSAIASQSGCVQAWSACTLHGLPTRPQKSRTETREELIREAGTTPHISRKRSRKETCMK